MGKVIEDVDELSQRYRVRRLTEADVEMVYALSVGNPMFYQHCPPFVTPKSILRDMKALPPRKDYTDKYYIGYFKGDELVAVMDLILGYPNEETAFVGLFMMAKERQGKGIGTAIFCFEKICNQIIFFSSRWVKNNYLTRRRNMYGRHSNCRIVLVALRNCNLRDIGKIRKIFVYHCLWYS